jgi:hypothetical protein
MIFIIVHSLRFQIAVVSIICLKIVVKVISLYLLWAVIVIQICLVNSNGLNCMKF